MVKNLPANARDTGELGLIPRSGRSPGGGNDTTAEATVNISALREMSPQASFSTAKTSDAKHFSDRALAPVVGVNGGPRFPLLRFEFPPSV